MRAGLTRERIVAEAIRQTEDDGYDKLALGAIARSFGTSVPSLYKHLGGLPEVRRAVRAHALQVFLAALNAADDSFPAVARAYRAFALAHPELYRAVQAAPAPDETELVELAEAILARVAQVAALMVVDDAASIDRVRIVRAALHGFVDLELSGAFGMPRDVDATFEVLLADLQ